MDEKTLVYELFQYKALTPRVLIVAVVNIITKDWSAYIDAVPGKNHDHEFKQVADLGSKLQFEIAKILFPTLNEKYTWRD